MIENVCAVPAHPFIDGVTVREAVVTTLVVLAATNGEILPTPFAASPVMLPGLFIHV